jgi:hypothetical protein
VTQHSRAAREQMGERETERYVRKRVLAYVRWSRWRG